MQREVILVPGLLEPRLFMEPLRRHLSFHCSHVRCWQDRIVFRTLPRSVYQLADAISSRSFRTNRYPDAPLALVTHSFGDWVARAAIAQQADHRVDKLVSLAPVMRAGLLPSVAHLLTGNLIPEIAIIHDLRKAMMNLDCDRRVKRFVIWAKIDESVRRVDLSQMANVESRSVWATHLSLALQPNVHRIVSEFIFSD